MEKAKESGKPEAIVEKMVEGGLAKFRKEHALLTQLFVRDNKTPVAEVVASAAKDAGAGIEIKGFVRFQLGEGIEKKESDFAAEVAAAAGSQRAEPVVRSLVSPEAGKGLPAESLPLPPLAGPSRRRRRFLPYARRRWLAAVPRGFPG